MWMHYELEKVKVTVCCRHPAEIIAGIPCAPGGHAMLAVCFMHSLRISSP